MNTEAYCRICALFHSTFWDGDFEPLQPSYAECRWLNESDVARAIERVAANQLSGKQADLAAAVLDAAGARTGRSKLVRRK